ncbi:Aldo/keto reductase [Apiospora saccharicola]|uniref:Aldo/keto reductase n=1 Tax=Apiospora saccharicola TaxID=335842 RepID=A0ABR1VK68_9PEZI
MWHGNASTDSETNMPIIFDAASFYAHNECRYHDIQHELAVWRQPWNKISTPFRMQYHQHFPKSKPEGDYDDRNLLYATLISSMRELVEKFPGGLEG